VGYLLSFIDKVRAKDHSLTRLNLAQRCTTSAAKQCFERCRSETLLVIVVVRELSQQQALVPFVLIVQHTSLEHIFKTLVHSFCLTIGLQMISQIVDQMRPKDACSCNQKRAVKWGPRSEMMVLGTPCRHMM
jgi:hypothetical protein